MLDREIVYERWLDFSLRLADTLDVTPARKEKIKNQIESFIHMYRYPAYIDKPILGWDGTPEGWLSIRSHADEYFANYEVWSRKREEYTGKFSNQLLSCIKAGLDVAVPNMCGGGVVGFTTSTIKRMYKDKVPSWLSEVLELEGNEPVDTPIWL
jgi:hypothetical protein